MPRVSVQPAEQIHEILQKMRKEPALMKIGDNTGTITGYQTVASKTGKYNNVREYANYLTGKYGCLTPCNNAAVSVTGGLLRKAMGDEKTGAWLERELGKAADYIEAAQKSAIAHGSTLKSVSIEFGEEYSTMTTLVVTDGGGTDPEIDQWLEKLKEKKEEQKAAEKKKAKAQKAEEQSLKMELKGKDLEDLTNQFSRKLSIQTGVATVGGFDVKA